MKISNQKVVQSSAKKFDANRGQIPSELLQQLKEQGFEFNERGEFFWEQKASYEKYQRALNNLILKQKKNKKKNQPKLEQTPTLSSNCSSTQNLNQQKAILVQDQQKQPKTQTSSTVSLYNGDNNSARTSTLSSSHPSAQNLNQQKAILVQDQMGQVQQKLLNQQNKLSNLLINDQNQKTQQQISTLNSLKNSNLNSNHSSSKNLLQNKGQNQNKQQAIQKRPVIQKQQVIQYKQSEKTSVIPDFNKKNKSILQKNNQKNNQNLYLQQITQQPQKVYYPAEAIDKEIKKNKQQQSKGIDGAGGGRSSVAGYQYKMIRPNLNPFANQFLNNHNQQPIDLQNVQQNQNSESSNIQLKRSNEIKLNLYDIQALQQQQQPQLLSQQQNSEQQVVQSPKKSQTKDIKKSSSNSSERKKALSQYKSPRLKTWSYTKSNSFLLEIEGQIEKYENLLETKQEKKNIIPKYKKSLIDMHQNGSRTERCGTEGDELQSTQCNVSAQSLKRDMDLITDSMFNIAFTKHTKTQSLGQIVEQQQDTIEEKNLIIKDQLLTIERQKVEIARLCDLIRQHEDFTKELRKNEESLLFNIEQLKVHVQNLKDFQPIIQKNTGQSLQFRIEDQDGEISKLNTQNNSQYQEIIKLQDAIKLLENKLQSNKDNETQILIQQGVTMKQQDQINLFKRIIDDYGYQIRNLKTQEFQLLEEIQRLNIENQQKINDKKTQKLEQQNLHLLELIERQKIEMQQKDISLQTQLDTIEQQKIEMEKQTQLASESQQKLQEQQQINDQQKTQYEQENSQLNNTVQQQKNALQQKDISLQTQLDTIEQQKIEMQEQTQLISDSQQKLQTQLEINQQQNSTIEQQTIEMERLLDANKEQKSKLEQYEKITELQNDVIAKTTKENKAVLSTIGEFQYYIYILLLQNQKLQGQNKLQYDQLAEQDKFIYEQQQKHLKQDELINQQKKENFELLLQNQKLNQNIKNYQVTIGRLKSLAQNSAKSQLSLKKQEYFENNSKLRTVIGELQYYISKKDSKISQQEETIKTLRKHKNLTKKLYTSSYFGWSLELINSKPHDKFVIQSNMQSASSNFINTAIKNLKKTPAFKYIAMNAVVFGVMMML